MTDQYLATDNLTDEETLKSIAAYLGEEPEGLYITDGRPYNKSRCSCSGVQVELTHFIGRGPISAVTLTPLGVWSRVHHTVRVGKKGLNLTSVKKRFDVLAPEARVAMEERKRKEERSATTTAVVEALRCMAGSICPPLQVYISQVGDNITVDITRLSHEQARNVVQAVVNAFTGEVP